MQSGAAANELHKMKERATGESNAQSDCTASSSSAPPARSDRHRRFLTRWPCLGYALRDGTLIAWLYCSHAMSEYLLRVGASAQGLNYTVSRRAARLQACSAVVAALSHLPLLVSNACCGARVGLHSSGDRKAFRRRSRPRRAAARLSRCVPPQRAPDRPATPAYWPVRSARACVSLSPS